MASNVSPLMCIVASGTLFMALTSIGCGDKPITQELLPNGWVFLSHSGKLGSICKPTADRNRFELGCPSTPDWTISVGDFKVIHSFVIGKYEHFSEPQKRMFFVFDTRAGSVREFGERSDFNDYCVGLEINPDVLLDE